jgi:hypothetical protein
LSLWREHAHGILGNHNDPTPSGAFDLTLNYERQALQDLSVRFQALLDDNSDDEEEIQKFFEKNLILFHRFDPEKIFFKTPILSKYKTDFTILTKSKQLILIEIEKPSTLLMRKEGDPSADFEHAVSQVQNWLFEYESYKLAVLSCIRIDISEVTSVRGVVIAGRDGPYQKDHLIRFKWRNRGNVDFFTYDDMLASVVGLAQSVGRL